MLVGSCLDSSRLAVAQSRPENRPPRFGAHRFGAHMPNAVRGLSQCRCDNRLAILDRRVPRMRYVIVECGLGFLGTTFREVYSFGCLQLRISHRKCNHTTLYQLKRLFIACNNILGVGVYVRWNVVYERRFRRLAVDILLDRSFGHRLVRFVGLFSHRYAAQSTLY